MNVESIDNIKLRFPVVGKPFTVEQTEKVLNDLLYFSLHNECKDPEAITKAILDIK